MIALREGVATAARIAAFRRPTLQPSVDPGVRSLERRLSRDLSGSPAPALDGVSGEARQAEARPAGRPFRPRPCRPRRPRGQARPAGDAQTRPALRQRPVGYGSRRPDGARVAHHRDAAATELGFRVACHPKPVRAKGGGPKATTKKLSEARQLANPLQVRARARQCSHLRFKGTFP